MTDRDFPLPDDLPRPVDDGAADHLTGQALPGLRLRSTDARVIVLASLGQPRAVLYLYPMTGRPGIALPERWDLIPGARGCTPESCGFRDYHAELQAAGAEVYGLSSQSTDYQKEAAGRLHLPFPLLSDQTLTLADALQLPTFTAGGMRLFTRLTMVIADGLIERVFYPVFPPDQHAGEVLRWLHENLFRPPGGRGPCADQLDGELRCSGRCDAPTCRLAGDSACAMAPSPDRASSAERFQRSARRSRTWTRGGRAKPLLAIRPSTGRRPSANRCARIDPEVSERRHLLHLRARGLSGKAGGT